MRSAALLALVVGCTGRSHVTVRADAPQRWGGQAELLVHDEHGALVHRATLTGVGDAELDAGDVLTIASEEPGAVAFQSYYALGEGDVLDVRLGTSSRPRTYIPLVLGQPAAATTWWAATPTAQTRSNDPYPDVDVDADRAHVPVIAAASSSDRVLAVYGTSAAPVGPVVTLDAPLATRAPSVTSASLGWSAWFAGAIELGGDVLPCPGGTDVVCPLGLGDRADVIGTVTTRGGSIARGASFAGDVPAQIDLDLGPPVPVISDARFDDARFAWQVDAGADAVALRWSLLSGTTSWTFAAPPDQGAPALPALPDDLAPDGRWLPGPLTVWASDTGAAYPSEIEPPAAHDGAGTVRWSAATHAIAVTVITRE
jgi:hypothetical protein